jgi:hypothetical protein
MIHGRKANMLMTLLACTSCCSNCMLVQDIQKTATTTWLARRCFTRHAIICQSLFWASNALSIPEAETLSFEGGDSHQILPLARRDLKLLATTNTSWIGILPTCSMWAIRQTAYSSTRMAMFIHSVMTCVWVAVSSYNRVPDPGVSRYY